jgi:hypothetical protein
MKIFKVCTILLILLRSGGTALSVEKPTDILSAGNTIADANIIKQEVMETKQGMYDYMDGGAELYFDHGWELLIAADLQGESNQEFKIELYVVKTHQDALDLLDTQRDIGDTTSVGDKAYYGAGMVVWVQGNYYIKLWSWKEYANVQNDILTIAKELSNQLTE